MTYLLFVCSFYSLLWLDIKISQAGSSVRPYYQVIDSIKEDKIGNASMAHAANTGARTFYVSFKNTVHTNDDSMKEKSFTKNLKSNHWRLR